MTAWELILGAVAVVALLLFHRSLGSAGDILEIAPPIFSSHMLNAVLPSLLPLCRHTWTCSLLFVTFLTKLSFAAPVGALHKTYSAKIHVGSHALTHFYVHDLTRAVWYFAELIGSP